MRHVACLLALALLGCGSSDTYVAAGVTTAANAALVGGYRATTKGCWGQCLHGRVCDEETGTCVRVEERDPAAPADAGRIELRVMTELGRTVRCELFEASGWPDRAASTLSVPVENGKAECTFDAIARGERAVVAVLEVASEAGADAGVPMRCAPGYGREQEWPPEFAAVRVRVEGGVVRRSCRIE